MTFPLNRREFLQATAACAVATAARADENPAKAPSLGSLVLNDDGYVFRSTVQRPPRRSFAAFCVLGLSGIVAFLSPSALYGEDRTIESRRQLQPAPGQAVARATRQGITLANGVAIELLTDDDAFLGLGRITIDSIVVRGGDTPMTVQCVAHGVHTAAPTDRPIPTMHQAAVLDQVRLHDDGLGADIVTDLQTPNQPDDRLTWVMRGFVESWRGVRSAGFSYRFRFQSGQRPIHQVRETSSWRLGDGVRGLLSIDRNESYGRQSWATVIDAGTTIKRWSFPAQRQWPEGRFSVGDVIDFLSAENISLVRYLDRPALTYKEVWLEPGAKELQSQEWYPTAATRTCETPAMHVRLVHAGGVNAWLDARDLVQTRYVGQTNIKPTPILPGVINGLAAMTTDALGKEYERLADSEAYVDWLVEHGLRRTWTWCRWKTAWTAWPHLTDTERAAIGTGLSHAVMTMEWDDAVVDLKRLNRLVEYGNQRGVESMLWIPGGHLCKVSLLRGQNPAWVVKRPDGQPFTYVYSDLGANFYSAGYGKYLLNALDRARQQIPFSGIWLDSFQVFGLDVIDYGRPDWPHQFDAAVEFVSQSRQRGLSVGTECAFPLALPASTGFYRVGELDGVEFLAYRVSQHFGGAELVVSPQLYFRLVAWMGPPLLRDTHWKQSPELSRVGAYVNKACNALQPVMHRPRYLPGNAGVLWLDANDRPSALFAFRDGSVQLDKPPKALADAVTKQTIAFDGASLRIEGLRVYQIEW